MIVDYDPLERPRRPRGGARRHHAIYPDAGSNVVFDTATLGMPEVTGDEFFDGCDVVGQGPGRQPARRPVPARGPRRRGGVGRRPPRAVAVAPSTPRALATPSRPPTGWRTATCASSPPTSAAASAPRSALPRGAAPGPPRQGGRPARALAGDPHARTCWRSATAGPSSRTSRIGGTRDGKVLAYRLDVLQDCGRFAEIGTVLAPFMTRPMASGVYAIPEHRVPTTSSSSPTPRPPSPTAAPAGPRPPPPSSGPWTCSPPRSAWTRSRCAART